MIRVHRFLVVSTLLVVPGMMHSAALAADAPAKRGKTEPRGTIGEPFVYKRVGDRALRMFVVKPTGWTAGDHRPAIVFFHGGGWTGGDNSTNTPPTSPRAGRFACRSNIVCSMPSPTSRRWFVSWTPSRRCAGSARMRGNSVSIRNGSRRAAAPRADTSRRSLAWSRTGDDPADDRKVSPRANALVLYNPVFDNGPDGDGGTARVGDRFKEFSPSHNISSDDPPAVVFVGTEVKLIPVKVVERFRDGMQEAGVRCDAHFYAGQGHGFFNYGKDGSKYYYETLSEADRFLASLGWLKGEPTLRPVPLEQRRESRD